MKKLKSNKFKYVWEKYYDDDMFDVEYPTGSIVEVLAESAIKYPNYKVLTYYNNTITYKELLDRIEDCAKSLKQIGVKQGDVVSICMPNTIEAIVMFYAVNMIGAISNMIHPLSSEKEIELYLNKSKSKVILTIDISYKKILNVINNTSVQKVIVGSAGDDLIGLKKFMYSIFTTDITKATKKIKEVFLKAFQNREVLTYKKFIKRGKHYSGETWVPMKGEDHAVILYSGGTSGTPKGIKLSNMNFNALAVGAKKMCKPNKAGDTMLCIMPIFHGFGLGVCLHSSLSKGMECILVPTFKAKKLASLIRKTKPNFFVGVPTMFEAIYNNSKNLKPGDLSSIHSIISGGDIMDETNLKKYNEFFKKYGSDATIRIGYGLTESTASTILSPRGIHKEKSIGIPFLNIDCKIIKPGTIKEVPYGEDGEICLSGPTIMMGYLDDEEETKKTLIKHKDGKIWLHTGDIGCMDKDGFVYFKSRLKRIIISSGYNIYPSYIEDVINKHEYVSSCTVIGVPDHYRGQIAKALIVLKKEVKLNDEVEAELKEYCSKYVAKYAMPRIFEFRKELPKTLVGKIAYSLLEEGEEENEKKDSEQSKKESKKQRRQAKKDKKKSKKK